LVLNANMSGVSIICSGPIDQSKAANLLISYLVIIKMDVIAEGSKRLRNYLSYLKKIVTIFKDSTLESLVVAKSLNKSS
jgi:hypothetical protein